MLLQRLLFFDFRALQHLATTTSLSKGIHYYTAASSLKLRDYVLCFRRSRLLGAMFAVAFVVFLSFPDLPCLLTNGLRRANHLYSRKRWRQKQEQLEAPSEQQPQEF